MHILHVARMGWSRINTVFFTLLMALVFLQSTLPCRALTPVSGVNYRIEDQATGLMLWENIYDGSSHVALVMMAFRGDGDASWTFTPNGSGYYTILNPLRNLVLGCDSGDSAVYLETPGTTDGKLWSLVDAGGGYVAIINKLNGNALTVQNTSGAVYTPVVTAANTSLPQQKFWLGEFRLRPIQTIAMPVGYAVSAAKRIVLCASNNLGGSVSGTLSSTNGTNSVSFTFAKQLWGQYYYTNTDMAVAMAPGTYMVSVSGFPTNSFLASDNFYRAIPNDLGQSCDISNIMTGFFAWQRETMPQTNMTVILRNSDGTYSLQSNSGDLHGGWKDASSIDIEMTQNSAAFRNLAYATEDTLNANDRSLLLSEVAFEAGFYLRAQNANGSFPIKIEPDVVFVSGVTGLVTANVDCGITARAVIGLAAAARVLKGYNDPLANQCFQAATNGWGWVKNNQNNYVNSDNIYPSYWWASADSVLGAALELAKTAPASSTYQSDASSFFNDGQFDGSGNWVKKSGSYVHQSSGQDAAMGLARYFQTLSATDPNRSAIITQLDNYYNAVTSSIDTPFGTDSGNFSTGFGNNSGYSTKAYIYLNLYHALYEERMLGTARDYMNWLYGANPFGSSFIIGFAGINVVPQFSRPRPSSIGEIIPGIVTTNTTLTTWGGSDYGVGEGGVADTSVLPAYMALMDNLILNSTLTPVARYSFDDMSGNTVINDGSGGSSMNGVLTNGAVIVAGKIGNAVGLSNNAAVFVNSGVTDLSGGGNWSVTAWIKTVQSGASLFSKGNDTTWSANNSTFYLTDGGANAGGKPGGVRYAQNWIGNSALPNVNDGNWHLIAYTDNAGAKTIYVDGVAYSAANNGWGTSTVEVGNKLWLGWSSGHDGSTNLNGVLDEVCIYNSALSANQIAALYHQVNLAPLARYSFDNIRGGVVINDGSGGSSMNGALTNGAVIVAGKIGNAVGLSNNAAVVVNSGVTDLSGGGTWSVTAWIKTVQSGASLFSKGNDTTWSANNSTFYLTDGSTSGGGKPGAVRYAQNWIGNSALPNVNDGNWHLIAYTDNAGAKTIYVDGASYSVPNNGWGTSTGDVGNKLWLGWTSGHDGSASLNGVLDEVCIFNSALSASQVTNLYNQTYVNPSYQNQSPSVGFATIIAPPTPLNFTGIAGMNDGAMMLSFTGPAAGNYSLWASTNAALPSGTAGWVLLNTGSFSNGTTSFIDDGATNYPARFYRITMP